MSWKYTGIVIAFMVMVCIEDTVGTGEALKALTIMDKNIRVCFNKNDGDWSDYDYYQLTIEDNAGDDIYKKPVPLNVPSESDLLLDTICLECPSDCLTTYDTTYLQGKNIKFDLHIQEKLNDGDPVPLMVIGAVSVMPSVLPVAPLDGKIYIIGTEENKIIKINDKIEGDGSLFLNDEDLSHVCASKPCYYKDNVDSTDGTKFAICGKKSLDDIPVCGISKEGIAIIAPDLSSATVSVNYDNSKVTLTSEGDTIQEVINTDLVVCTTPASCDLVTVKGEVVLVDYTNIKFGDVTIVDRELDTFAFGKAPNSVVEVIWNKDKNDFYQMSRTTGNNKETFHSAKVDCSALPAPMCNAYFTEVEIAVHVITIKEITGWGTDNPLVGDDNWKQTVDVKTKIRDVRMIHVDSNAITMTETNIELDVCFKYVLNISRESTHYEFLAVNSKGKWKKEIGDKKKDETHACFHGLELPLADFSESSNLFVLLRDSDNGKPLASGEVTFDLPAVRAIKPEVDNGNNGSTSTLAIVGAAITGIACLMALVAAAVMFVMKIYRNNDGLQYPLQHNNIEDSSTIHGLDNSIPTM